MSKRKTNKRYTSKFKIMAAETILKARLSCKEAARRFEIPQGDRVTARWELKHEHKASLLIAIADIPRSTYYCYSKQFSNPKPDKYAEIKEEIRNIYDNSKGRYGYRKITKEINGNRKDTVNVNYSQ